MRYKSVLVLCCWPVIATQVQSASLKTFEAGERVKAAEVNGNFEYLEQKINPLINDSAPTIEVLNFGYDSSAARYTGDLIISDESELFWIKVQVGYLSVPTDFVNASGPQDMLSNYGGFLFPETGSDDSVTSNSDDDHSDEDDDHSDEHDASTSNRYLQITDFWPAPSTSEVRILGAVFRPDTEIEEGPVQIVAQDTSGKLNRLVIQVPAWPGGLFSSGTYLLDGPISLDLAAVETACGINASNDAGYFNSSSYTISETFGYEAPVTYFLSTDNQGGGSAQADADESEIQFVTGGSSGSSSAYGSWYSDSTVTMRFISDSVVSFDAYYECGSCEGSCYEEENKVAAFTYSSGEITAVLTAED